jgi:hypothetical protein
MVFFCVTKMFLTGVGFCDIGIWRTTKIVHKYTGFSSQSA